MSELPAETNTDTQINQVRAKANSKSTQLSFAMRFTLIVHGVVLPLLLFAMSLVGWGMIDRPWQSGETKMYAAMLLKPLGWLPFAPAIVLCMVSLCKWNIDPSAGQRLWVRLGIATGVVLSLQYLAILCVAMDEIALLVAALIVWCIWHTLIWIVGLRFWRTGQFGIGQVMVWTTISAVVVAAASFFGTSVFGGSVLYLPFFVAFGLIVAAPGLNVIAYVTAAWRIFIVERSPTTGGFWLASLGAGWLAVWLASWRVAVLVMLDQYSKLPTTNPNCYLANAAAFAHPLLTGCPQRGQVTTCMRRLKFLELVFKAAAPTLHRGVRQYYDRKCPPLAALCSRYQLLASATCLLLKPLELAAVLAGWLLRIDAARVAQLYRG